MSDPTTTDSAKADTPGFINWRDFDPSQLPVGSSLRTELTTYRDNLDELLQHRGQWVVIKGDAIFGIFDDRDAALHFARTLFGCSAVLVKKIVELEPVRRLGNVLL